MTDTEKIAGIMRKGCTCAYLATCDGDQPRLRAVSPIVDDDLTVWVATHPNSNKVNQIKANPKVELLFLFPHGQGEEEVKVTGVAGMVDDLDVKNNVWDRIEWEKETHFPDGYAGKQFGLMRIDPDRIAWRESWTSGMCVWERG